MNYVEKHSGIRGFEEHCNTSVVYFRGASAGGRVASCPWGPNSGKVASCPRGLLFLWLSVRRRGTKERGAFPEKLDCEHQAGRFVLGTQVCGYQVGEQWFLMAS